MSELLRDDHWQRLDPRMLLVHPIKEVLRFLPVLAGIFIAGTASGGRWHLLGVAIPISLGILRYLTTSFRITAGRIELRRGLLNRHVLSTPVDRVRTVDLTASPIHRVLGLTTVRVGTGTASTEDADRLDLDGLPVLRARQLREELLHATPEAREWATAVDNVREVLRFDPAWIRFAPLTSSGLVITAAVFGAASQVANQLGWFEQHDLRDLASGLPGGSLWVVVPLAVGVLALVVSALSIGGYVVTYWGFQVTHTRADGSWHLRRGLFTTRETSLDDDRVSGVSIAEPLGLRLVGGGRLSAIVTGLDRKRSGSSVLVPPAPIEVVLRTARAVLGVTGPVDAALTGHGPRARTRRFTRATLPVVLAGVATVAAQVLGGAPLWLATVPLLALAAALALAHDRAGALGHVLVDGYVVARSGSLVRRREALAVDDVIGWNFTATWFQRRAGLTCLVGTTAGGAQSVMILDVPEDAAVELAAGALPDLVGQFRA